MSFPASTPKTPCTHPNESSTLTPIPAIVDEIRPNDVLLGRGVPCNANEGNVRFRSLVQKQMQEYQSAERRLRKDGIARGIIATIEARGGRFLRLAECAENNQLRRRGNNHVWEVAEDEVILLKVKQALRGKCQKKVCSSRWGDSSQSEESKTER